MSLPHLRLATPADRPAIQQVEQAAAALFDEADVAARLQAETLDGTVAATAIRSALLWVAESPDRGVVAFLAASVVDGYLHILEMSVLPSHGRMGIGTALIGTALDASRERAPRGVTLTTFSHIPWNAPWYERLGFRRLEADEAPLHVGTQLAHEAQAGLRHRIGMMRRTTGQAGAAAPGNSSFDSSQPPPNGGWRPI